MLVTILYFVTFLVVFPFNLYKSQPLNINLKKPIPDSKKVLVQKTNIKNDQKPTLPETAGKSATPTWIPSTPTNSPDNAQNLKTNNSSSSSSDWGVAKQVEGDTYTVKVQDDSQMAKPSEILIALNSYRTVHGKGALVWDNNLADFAQGRAEQFNKDGKLDNHAGFNQLFTNPDNVKKLGFLKLGENSSIGYTLDAVHIIEWVYASDAPHNNNQLDSDWTHVGVGVSGNSTDLVFGGSKL